MSENASGKADGSTDTETKDSSVCPTCGDSFKSERGMKAHHTQIHGESIAGVKTICGYCGDTIRVERHRIEDSENVYCGSECMSKHYQTFEGEDNPLYSRIEYDCDYCGQTMERKPSRLEYHDYLFCSTECREAHYEECDEYVQKQENEKCEIECEICGNLFEVIPFRKDTATYCSAECRIEYTKQLTGEDHPNYKLDKPESNFYQSKAWKETRGEALEQAGYKCQACGSEEDLVGHHVVPLSAGGEPYDTQNVSILCRTCHMEWEGLFLAPDNRD